MCDYWCNFIRSGDPNGTDSQGEPLPPWPALDRDHPMRMVFAQTPEAEDCAANPLTRFLLSAYLSG